MAIEDVFSDPQVIELIEAAVDGDRARVRALTAAGVDPNARGLHDATPLMWACLADGRLGVEGLLEVGADPLLADDGGRTSVHLAAIAEDPGPLDALLEGGVDIDVRNPRTETTALTAAMMEGREDRFHRLLDGGADPTVVSKKGDTLLHTAGKINATGCILMLLDAGTDPTALNKQGRNFKDYLDMTPVDVLPEQAQGDLPRIGAWLDEHGIALTATERPPRLRRTRPASASDDAAVAGTDGFGGEWRPDDDPEFLAPRDPGDNGFQRVWPRQDP